MLDSLTQRKRTLLRRSFYGRWMECRSPVCSSPERPDDYPVKAAGRMLDPFDHRAAHFRRRRKTSRNRRRLRPHSQRNCRTMSCRTRAGLCRSTLGSWPTVRQFGHPARCLRRANEWGLEVCERVLSPTERQTERPIVL